MSRRGRSSFTLSFPMRFGEWSAPVRNRLPADHSFRDIGRAVDFAFVEEETADLYSADQGRPCER
ncbi:hypothetical protein SA87_04550 [Hydrogenibacillus schlegelii]|uniref:Uncharacterized protein n=1 Tax=Hydrogenibacillus schlegelii TaxID=1484 RepID=A0A179IQ45_HYDSH|nr:hypothetical protein SA87_04550 [Hydrogenibacillus schlegelii]